MELDPVYVERIGRLKSECVSTGFLSELFSVPWPPPEEAFAHDFGVWVRTRYTKNPCGGDLVSRWIAETFLQDRRLRPLPWAAAKLGMTPESLRAVLSRVSDLGLRKPYEMYSGLIDNSLENDLINSLKGLRFRTFGTHDSFCELFHGALSDALRIKIEQWLCATAAEMGEYPQLYAYYLDSITLKPLSVKHSVWLDLGKPLNLPPDRFSKLFYVRHRKQMRPLLAGRGEPEGLEEYERFLAGGAGGHG